MPVKHGFAPVKSQGKWGIVNLRGEWVVQPQYEDIEIFIDRLYYNKSLCIWLS